MADNEKTGFGWDRFAKVQASLPTVTKAGKGNYGDYMKLDDLNPAMIKVLNDHNFVWVTMPSIQDGKPCLRYSIVDTESGVSIGDIMELSVEKNTPQAQGSAITYARRYSLTAMTGLVADIDDDGASGGGKAPKAVERGVEELKADMSLVPAERTALREWYAALTASEKVIALPIIQEKLSEVEAA